MASTKKKTALPVPKKGQVVRVVNARAKDGYRRGGVKHPKGQKDWPHDAFSEDQLKLIDADPRLDASVVDAPKAAAAD
jgi:hypothetical protein